jgi:hypothetical protein
LKFNATLKPCSQQGKLMTSNISKSIQCGKVHTLTLKVADITQDLKPMSNLMSHLDHGFHPTFG